MKKPEDGPSVKEEVFPDYDTLTSLPPTLMIIVRKRQLDTLTTPSHLITIAVNHMYSLASHSIEMKGWGYPGVSANELPVFGLAFSSKARLAPDFSQAFGKFIVGILPFIQDARALTFHRGWGRRTQATREE